jgi:general secretion pathway protein F
MARFRFQAIAEDGTPLDGDVVASTEREALRTIEGRGLRVTALHPEVSERALRRRALRSEDVTLALHELASLVSSGVTLAESVNAQAGSGHHPRIRQAFADVAAALRRGEGFASTLPKVDLPLPGYVHTLIASGEKAGLLGSALQDAVRQLEYEQGIRGEIRQALTYPVVLVVAGIGAVSLMFTFVVPKFGSLLERAEDLPLLALAVLRTGLWAREYWPWLAAVIALAAAGGAYRLQSAANREALQEWLERLPVLGPWRVEAETARWSKILGILLANRVPLMDALALARSGVATPRRRARLGEVEKAVRSGRRLADALEEQQVLTPTGYNLVRVGERAGELPAMLASLAKLCEENGKTRMKRFLALLEPAAIVVIGGFIGLIMIGIILAITSANDLAI